MTSESLDLEDSLDDFGLAGKAAPKPQPPAAQPKKPARPRRGRSDVQNDETLVACGLCDVKVPRKEFPLQSKHCFQCKRAVESLDSQAKSFAKSGKKEQADAYYTMKRAQDDAFKKLVAKHIELNPDSSVRNKEKVDFARFRETIYKDEAKLSDLSRKFLTQKQWVAHATSLEGGDKPMSLALKEWSDFLDDESLDYDFLGYVDGVGGQLRVACPVGKFVTERSANF